MNCPVLLVRWVGCSVVSWHGAGPVLCCERVPRVILLDGELLEDLPCDCSFYICAKNKSPSYFGVRYGAKHDVYRWQTE